PPPHTPGRSQTLPRPEWGIFKRPDSRNFQTPLTLLDLNQELLALPPEQHVPELIHHQLQVFDLLAARLQLSPLQGERLKM
ncbi:MAG: hypothetical protein WBG54_04685, partial [Acidobacteriaceae bacterium]